MVKRLVLGPAALLLLLGLALLWLFWPTGEGGLAAPAKPAGPIGVDAKPEADIEAHYIGSVRCGECHAAEMQSWEGSHHDRAMEVPSPETVEGDFSDVTFEHKGVTSRFYRKNGDYYVYTEGRDGEMRHYKVAYTFGVYPLQQYLVHFEEDGRLQTLPLCWDNRPAAEGGQRWFHIYPEQRIPPDDALHWTGPMQNWNTQCAECHSTNLKKNYRPASDTYETTFSQINVSCEACHGPGSEHARWAQNAGGSWYGGEGEDEDMGLVVNLKEDEPGQFIWDEAAGKPVRTNPLDSQVQLRTCARCHARREVTSEKFVPGEPFLESHMPTLLEQPLYHTDGAIREEVYVWGSFVQSKMHAEGVRCVDCHDPHSLDIHTNERDLCLQCHSGETYATPDHHFHESGEPGSSCVDCHMPQETYMVVDPRRDHSFRVPRPDRSAALGTPNSCNKCHTEESTDWAMKHWEQWWGEPGEDPKQFAYALHADRAGRPDAGERLRQIAGSEGERPIARATALARLRRHPSREALQVVRDLIESDEALLRLAGLRALSPYDASRQWQLGAVLLNDAVRSVRLEAARTLAEASTTEASGPEQGWFDSALAELFETHERNADRAGTQVEHANVQLALGNEEAAETAYRTAIARDKHHIPAYMNLADLYRQQGEEQQARAVLHEAIDVMPEAPAPYYALALSRVRGGEQQAAIEPLEKARELAPENTQYLYVLATAYHSLGRGDDAVATLKEGLKQHPENEQLLRGMATIGRDNGRLEEARAAARKLVELSDGGRQYQQLLRSLQR